MEFFNPVCPMKKFLYLAVGFLAVFACSRETVDPVHPENPSVDTTEPIQVTLTTGSVETRTELRLGDGNRLHPFWTSEDDVNVILIPTSTDDLEYYEEDDDSYFVNPENHFGITLLENGAQAEFTGTVPSAGDYLAFYPRLVLGENEYGEEYPVSGAYSDVYVDDNYIEGIVRFEVPSLQRPSSTSFDPTADLLISSPFKIDDTTQPTTVGTSFTRMNAIVKLVLVNQTGIEGFDNQEVRRVSIGTSYISSGGDEGGDYYGAPALRNRTSGRTRASVYDSDENGEHYYSDRGLAGQVGYCFRKGDDGFWDNYYLDDARHRSVTAEYDESSAYTIGESGENGTATYLIVVPGILKNEEWEYEGESRFDGLHIRVETDGYVIDRNVKLPSGGIALQPSSVTTLQIGLYPDGVKETTIMKNGFSFMHWDEEEETSVNFSSLSVKEDSFEEFWVSLVGLTLDDNWEDELQVSCEPSGFVRVNLDEVYYEEYSNELYNLEVWGDRVTDTPVTVTFSARGISSSFEVNVVKANTPASISLGAGVSRIDLDQYDPMSLNATITPDDPDEPLDVNYDNFACTLIDSNGSESLISGATFEVSGADPSEMVITLPAISEAGEFNLEITYKEASLLTIPFKVWAGAALPEALQNWSGPSGDDISYNNPVKTWFDEYRNPNNQLKAYKASQLSILPEKAFRGAFSAEIPADSFVAFGAFTGITEISQFAFSDCASLTGITLPDGINSIGDNAFKSCKALTSIQLPESVTAIGNNAFVSSGIGSINLPEGLESIGESAFNGCGALQTITIPGSIETFGDFAFANSGLTTISFSPDIIQLRELPSNVFYGTGHLTSVNIPQSVEVIGESAFSNSGLSSVVIPEGVTMVGESAFAYTQLTTVTLPSTVTSIGEYAFSNCPMTSAYLLPVNPPTVAGNAFRPTRENEYFKYPIYVPYNSYDSYISAAANWIEASGYIDTSRIQRMPENPNQ